MTETQGPVRGPSQGRPDLYLTVLYAPDRASFARLSRKEILDIGPMRTLPDSKTLEVHLYASEKQIARLREAGWKLEVRENLSEVGRQRQGEVGKGDRYEGGRVVPRGLGRKPGRED